MSIAIVITTHGAAAQQLLKTAEMLVGEQDNIAFTDFVPGENAETLIEKYHQKLAMLDTHQGVLFLVDTWGGSPFNAASRVVVDKTCYDVVTGVNVPMLLEIFMAREDNLPFEELVTLALRSGREGIRALQASPLALASSPPSSASEILPASVPLSEGHLQICLARIDDRLIHGQVVTRWTKETSVSRIIVVSDEVAADSIRSTLLKQVAPPGVTAHVVDVEKMVRVYNNPKYANQRVMLLFTNPADVLRLVNAGVEITSINVGGMAFQQGRTQVNNAISVGEEDIDAFKKLAARGIELEVRKVANDTPLKMMDLIK